MIASTVDPKDVCLVLMPYAALERPSIALSILKATLNNHDISSKVIYGNLMFAEQIGPQVFDMICKSQSHCLAGEWTFSAAAFDGYSPDHDAYFDHTHRGIDGLSSFISAMGSSVEVTELLWRLRNMADALIEQVAWHILDHHPKIVGCSSTFQQHCASLALLRKIKELAPDVVTMLGGANCESSMGLVTHKNCTWVDYVFSGEADTAFPALCEMVLAGNEPQNIKEVPKGFIAPFHRKEAYKSITLQVPRGRITDMEESPTPDYSDYFDYLDNNEIGKYLKPGLLIESSRGCWWGAIKHCTFCGLNGESMSHRSKSDEKVLNEINELYAKHKIPRVEAVDNILDMKYFKTLLPKLAEQEEKLEFFYETKANLNRENLAMLAKAGVSWIQPGIESLDDTLLDLIDKGTKARHNIEMMKWAQEYGIYIIWVWLYDIPGDNDKLYLDMAEWLPQISHLQTPGGLSFIQYNRFSPYHMYPEKYDLKLKADKSYQYIYPWSEEDIENFAYYFDDYNREREQIQSFQKEELQNPGMQAIKRVFHEWQQGWVKRMYPTVQDLPIPSTLYYLIENDGIRVFDTRPVAVAKEHFLQGLSSEVHELCDSSLKFASLLKQVNLRSEKTVTESQLQEAIDQLISLKLMLNLNGYYLSLAVKGPLKFIPPRVDYPGGRVMSFAEVQGQEMMEAASSDSIMQSTRFV